MDWCVFRGFRVRCMVVDCFGRVLAVVSGLLGFSDRV